MQNYKGRGTHNREELESLVEHLTSKIKELKKRLFDGPGDSISGVTIALENFISIKKKRLSDLNLIFKDKPDDSTIIDLTVEEWSKLNIEKIDIRRELYILEKALNMKAKHEKGVDNGK